MNWMKIANEQDTSCALQSILLDFSLEEEEYLEIEISGFGRIPKVWG